MNYIMLTSPHYCTSPVPLAQIDLSDCPVIWRRGRLFSFPLSTLTPAGCTILASPFCSRAPFRQTGGEPHDRFSVFRFPWFWVRLSPSILMVGLSHPTFLATTTTWVVARVSTYIHTRSWFTVVCRDFGFLPWSTAQKRIVPPCSS